MPVQYSMAWRGRARSVPVRYFTRSVPVQYFRGEKYGTGTDVIVIASGCLIPVHAFTQGWPCQLKQLAAGPDSLGPVVDNERGTRQAKYGTGTNTLAVALQVTMR
jgi:hypothetical protein